MTENYADIFRRAAVAVESLADPDLQECAAHFVALKILRREGEPIITSWSRGRGKKRQIYWQAEELGQ